MRRHCFCLEYPIASKGCQDLSSSLKNQLLFCLKCNCESPWKFCIFCVIEEIIGKISKEETVVEKELCSFHNEHGLVGRRLQPLVIGKEILRKFPNTLLKRFFPEVSLMEEKSTEALQLNKSLAIVKSLLAIIPATKTTEEIEGQLFDESEVRNNMPKRAKQLTRDQIKLLGPIIYNKYEKSELPWKKKIEKITDEIHEENHLEIKPHTVARIYGEYKKSQENSKNAEPETKVELIEKSFTKELLAPGQALIDSKALDVYGLAIQKVISRIATGDGNLLSNMKTVSPGATLYLVLNEASKITREEQLLIEEEGARLLETMRKQ